MKVVGAMRVPIQFLGWPATVLVPDWRRLWVVLHVKEARSEAVHWLCAGLERYGAQGVLEGSFKYEIVALKSD